MLADYFNYVNFITKPGLIEGFDPWIDHLGKLCSIARGHTIWH